MELEIVNDSIGSTSGFTRRTLQIRDLNSGTFGFVELALDKITGQQVAIKFIERGDKVKAPEVEECIGCSHLLSSTTVRCWEAFYLLLFSCLILYVRACGRIRTWA